MDFTAKKSVFNPRSKANPISQIFFLWVFPLFREGNKKNLDINDIYDVLPSDSSEKVTADLEKIWDEELVKAKEKGRKPKFLNAVISYCWKRFALLTIFYCFDNWVLLVSQPLFLRYLIRAFEEDSPIGTKCLYAAGVVVSTFMRSLVIHTSVFAIFHIGMQCRVGISTLIYKKALRLSKAAQGETTVGQIVNILSNDINRFDTNLNFVPWIISGPGMVIIFIYLLWDDFEGSTMVGLGFIILLIPYQYYIGKYSAIYRFNIATKTDERGRIMNEIIIAMRVIKMYAWEKPFSTVVDLIRKLEVKEIRKRGHLRGLQMSMFAVATKVVPYLVFLTYLLLGNNLTSEKVFFALACFNSMIQVMIHFVPFAFAMLGELMVAIRRIETFLLLGEQQALSNISSKNPDQPVQIHMENAKASWTGEKPTLQNVNLHIEGSKLLMVVGPVGSGKTSFLHALISELPIASGKLHLNGTTSYASQEPWIFAGNLRQNILFGLPYEEDRYQATVKMCELVDDLKQLPYGDTTVVGERGVALSGGQKARVNLARTLYRRADIYLLDDPLSAVDARVSRNLFEVCVKQKLEGSLRVLVTHQLQYLSQADHILVFNEGNILAQGSYQQLVDDGIDFVSLMTSETDDESSTRKASVVKPEEPKEEKTKDEPASDAEKMSVGSVTAATYWEYFRSGGALCATITLFLGFVVTQLLNSGTDYWLSFWTNAEAKRSRNDTVDCKDYSEDGCEDGYLGRDIYLYTYSGLAVAVFLITNARSLYFFAYCTKISVNIHNRMFVSLVRAPTKFFDDNPSGRVMNRFTKDVGAMDELLPPAMYDTLYIFLQMIGVVAVVIISNYYMSIPTLFLFFALGYIRKFFVKTARDLKRIESITRSPLFTQVASTMQGLTTIRASQSQNILLHQFNGHQDLHSATWYLFLAANRWFGIWLEMISILYLAIVTFSFLAITDSNVGGNIGLAISSALTLMGSFQWGMRQSAETENFMTSVERALEYTRLEPEAAIESKSDMKPPKDWPRGGEIEFRKVSLAYDSKKVLKNLSFSIKSNEKIGIVGRTGAGKSSIIAALFRMTEPSGDIFIDGVKINDIGLHDLRKSISIIPQDPVLFSGTIRYNLDPFEQFSDDELWSVIKETELTNGIPSLDFKVSDGGGNFSVGEKQLVCLARAILRKNNIIVMDEATANVDPMTDSFIQKTIRTKFAKCSIITIAHRLHSVIDCDRILVLDQGVLEEYDHPHLLLQNVNGILSSMVNHTGKSSAAALRHAASEAYAQRQKPHT